MLNGINLGQFASLDEAGNVLIRFSVPAEGKIAIKELKLAKKEIALRKKVIAQQIAEIRADYRQRSAQRGPAVRGGGTIGRVMRAIDQSGRYADKRAKEQQIEPLEQQKFALERMAASIDRLILLVEQELTT